MATTARDDVYCHIVSRRAVARAALCLHLESLSQEALDTLGGVLVAYLERVGAVLAASVQVSGRSSAHVNVLDALRATEQCTCEAVQRVQWVSGSTNSHSNSSTSPDASGTNPLGETATTSSEYNQHQHPAASMPQDRSWKGLAAFCFGPDWHAEDTDTKERQALNTMTAGGGKVGPSSIGQGQEAQDFHGWNAPYPDEVPPFPQVLGDAPVANPHALPDRVGRSLHVADSDKDPDDGLAEILKEVPDAVFTSEWGTWKQSDEKRRADAMEVDDENGAPVVKRLRFTETEVKESPMDAEIPENRLWVPFFFPDFPQPAATIARAVVDRGTGRPTLPVASGAATRNPTVPAGATLQVRSALVALDKHEYWGSSWQDEPPRSDDTMVPPGRSDQAETAVQPLIVPLGRASGSRVSKILEGSMEPSMAA